MGLKFQESFTPTTKYAGGLLFNKTSTEEFINGIDSIEPTPVSFNNSILWFGKAFHLKKKNKLSSGRSNIILSASLYRYNYLRRPKVAEYSLYKYHNRVTTLGSISYTKQSYYKTNYLYSFGRIEDIPNGSLATLTFGPEIDDDYKIRFYSSLCISSGHFLKNLGYIYAGLDVGFFTNDEGEIEQGMINLRLRYFTKLYKLGDFKFRHFVKIKYTDGINRYNDEFLYLNNSQGIRGFNTDSLYSRKRLVINLENAFFSPLYIYGFRFVFYSFVDLGFLGPHHKNIFSNKLYSGIGIGVRFRNEKLVFRTFQIQLSFYPGSPLDVNKTMLDASGEPRLRPDNFKIEAPEILKY